MKESKRKKKWGGKLKKSTKVRDKNDERKGMKKDKKKIILKKEINKNIEQEGNELQKRSY